VVKEDHLPPVVDKKDVSLVESILAPEATVITH